jgi:5'-nucleotidase
MIVSLRPRTILSAPPWRSDPTADRDAKPSSVSKDPIMRCTTAPRARCALLLAVVSLLLGACSSADEKPAPRAAPLDILLTNDDGWDAEGITVLYDALRERGHRVTLVGPATNQSGASMSTTAGPLAVSRPVPDEPKYAVTGTPVDAVMVGLTGVLRKAPDLVVSGTNRGANVAYNVNYSGTVGAATAAAERDVPAIAVSADAGDGDQADYQAAAEVVTGLVDSLAHGDGLDELGGDGLLNVNVPVKSSRGPKGVRTVGVGEESPWAVRYRDSGDGTFVEDRTYSPRVGSASDDAQQLADGYVVISWLTPERTAHDVDDLDDLLDGFSLPS